MVFYRWMSLAHSGQSAISDRNLRLIESAHARSVGYLSHIHHCIGGNEAIPD